MEKETTNKILWIYYNFKETADILSKKDQKDFWWMVVNYAFGEEKLVEDEMKNVKKDTKIAFLSIKSLLKLRKSGGSQNGKSNNPSGLVKREQPNIGANIGANITPNPLIKENKIKEIKIKKKPMVVSDDWQPTDETRKKLLERGIEDVDACVEYFKGQCQAKGIEYVNYDRAILNWRFNNLDFKKKNNNFTEDDFLRSIYEGRR